MFFGKLKDSADYGFGVFEDRFDSYIEINDDEHMKIIDEANSTGKIIKANDKGYPLLVDPPEPSKTEKAKEKITQLMDYLSQTDWYVIRFADEGKEIPIDIRNKRHEARIEISKLREVIKE